jgi:predicted amidophosphoribosyltransferase
MKVRYCWRCGIDVPMLDKYESQIASELYSEAFQEFKKLKKIPFKENFTKLLDYYNTLTGFGETEPNAIMHHFIDLYGPDCENCGKPYRTYKASFCAGCGHKR